MPYLVTLHTEDRTSRYGRTRSHLVTTEWHMEISFEDAALIIAAEHNGRNIRQRVN